MESEDKKPEEHAPVKVFMNPIQAVQKAAELLKRNPRDRALRIERDVLESLLLGFIDYAQQLNEFKKAKEAVDGQIQGNDSGSTSDDPGSARIDSEMVEGAGSSGIENPKLDADPSREP